MKILQMFQDFRWGMPDTPSIKGFVSEKREACGDDHKFLITLSQMLGCRSYNNFLDYSLFAIKLNGIHNKHCVRNYYVQGTWDKMKEAIERLLADDRHDMYQNIPYYLEDIATTIEEAKDTDVEIFWKDVVDAMIQCINTDGTGDISTTYEVPETT